MPRPSCLKRSPSRRLLTLCCCLKSSFLFSKNLPSVCGSHASSCISSQEAGVDGAFLLTLPVSSGQTSAVMASPECETTMGEWGGREWIHMMKARCSSIFFYLFVFFISHGSERERVCVWRRRYVTDPRPVPWVGKGRRRPGPFKVMTALGWELRRIEQGGCGGRGGGALGISLHHLLSLFFLWFLYWFRLCAFLRRLLLRSALSACLSSRRAVCAWHRGEGGGGVAPGSLCNTVMRGDVVIQQFLPKGHICSLSFLLPVSVWISVCLSRMHSAVSARAPAPRYHPLCINIKWKEIIFHSWLLGLARGVFIVGRWMPCGHQADHSQVKL